MTIESIAGILAGPMGISFLVAGMGWLLYHGKIMLRSTHDEIVRLKDEANAKQDAENAELKATLKETRIQMTMSANAVAQIAAVLSPEQRREAGDRLRGRLGEPELR